jgi:hypothetical protein
LLGRRTKDRKAVVKKVDLIFDKDVVGGLKGQKLADQIAAFTLACAPLPMAKDRTTVDEKRKAIKDVIDLFHLGKWSLNAFQEESSTEEEKDGDGDLEDSDN